jgi:hypothetical protein
MLEYSGKSFLTRHLQFLTGHKPGLQSYVLIRGVDNLYQQHINLCTDAKLLNENY